MQQADDWLGVPQVTFRISMLSLCSKACGPPFGEVPISGPGILPPVQVIAPEEIVDPNVDEHSVMTYLSQFPKAKLKPGAPLRAKTLHPKKAKAFGPGA